jgi:replicative DNA helicase
MLDSVDSSATLPQNVEAERAVLGAILIDRMTLALVAHRINERDFFLDTHRRIFRAISDLDARSSAIDLVTVREELDRTGAMEKAGGAAYLASLVDGIPDIANAEHYARIIKEKAALRRLVALGQTLSREGAAAERAPEEIIGDATSEIFDIAQDSARGEFVRLGEVVEHNLEVIEEARGRQGVLTGLATGFQKLDRLTSGLQRGELIIVAARPSVGKTAFALNIAQHVALREARSVGFFSLEMSKEALGLRVLCSEAKVNAKKMRDGFGSDSELRQLALAQTQIAGARFYIDDTSALTVPEMRAKCQRLKRENGLDLIAVDYLQLMAGHGRQENRTQEVSQISRGLKLLAKDLATPVIALSQLSRQTERRTGDQRKPQLADLRDSGSIEQDADVVIFLYREEMYDRDTERRNIADVIIAKQRNGPVDDFELVFLAEQTTFRNYSPVAEPGF